MIRSTPTFSILALLTCMLMLPGCVAAVPILSAGAAAGEAGKAGFSFWRSGMLTYVDEGTADEMKLAMTRMIDRLALDLHETKVRLDDNGHLRSRWRSIRTDRGHLVTIEVRPLTEAMIEVKINAGAFGNRAAAELIADRLKAELDEIQAGDVALVVD